METIFMNIENSKTNEPYRFRLSLADKPTVCSCHVMYAFESESTLYSCLNVKELLARSRREI